MGSRIRRNKMERLTTIGEYPHGAEGISPDKLTGRWCRGEFEATACVERLAEYENIGLTPEQISVWIPVEERLPEGGEVVLATDGKHIYLVEYEAGDVEFGDIDGVIAWMPLPEPNRPERK